MASAFNFEDVAREAADQARRRRAKDAGEPEPPRPLIRELPPAPEFPTAALGKLLADAAEGIRDRVQAPASICGQAVLGAASLSAQAHADVMLPTGQTRPLSLFLVTVAGTGERKSSADQEALWPVHAREKELAEAHKPELAAYEMDHAAWRAERDAILKGTSQEGRKRKTKDRDAIRRALEQLGPAPNPPLDPLLICPEPTYEGLVKQLERGYPALGLFSAEGGQFLGGYAMSADNRLKTSAALSDLWDGSAVRRVRSLDGTRLLYGRRLALHLMMQPGVAAGLLGDASLADQGLLSRLLVGAPDTAAGTRFWRDPVPESDLAVRRYGGRLLALLRAPLPLAPDTQNELKPRELKLSAEARRLWIAYADHVEAELRPGAFLATVRGFANKLPEHAARLAGVLSVVADHEGASIPVALMEAGIALADFYAAEALRLAEAQAVAPDLTLAQRTLDWLHRDWPEPSVSLPDLYRLGPNAIRDAATAKRVVAILEEHGWLGRVAGGAVVAGVPRRDVWSIVRP